MSDPPIFAAASEPGGQRQWNHQFDGRGRNNTTDSCFRYRRVSSLRYSPLTLTRTTPHPVHLLRLPRCRIAFARERYLCQPTDPAVCPWQQTHGRCNDRSLVHLCLLRRHRRGARSTGCDRQTRQRHYGPRFSRSAYRRVRLRLGRAQRRRRDLVHDRRWARIGCVRRCRTGDAQKSHLIPTRGKRILVSGFVSLSAHWREISRH